MHVSDSLRTVALCSLLAAGVRSSGQTASFEFGPLSPIQGTGVAFTVSLTARDAGGQVNTTHADNVALDAYSPGTSFDNQVVGFGTETTGNFLFTYYHDSRSQMIFLASELEGAGSITNLSMMIDGLPSPGVMENCTVRFKHTALSAYPETPEFETTGWHTGYRASFQPLQVNEWVSVPIDPPFAYDGTQNLMVDFSFDNDTYDSSGTVYATGTGSDVRHFHGASDSGEGDPRDWTGSEATLDTWSHTYRPNLRFAFLRPTETPVAVQPTVMLGPAFSQGVWQGNATINTVRSNVVLRATLGGIKAVSGAFHVVAQFPMPSDWLAQFGLPPNTDPDGNPDDDPFTTLEEYVADTNPTNGLSYLHVTAYEAGPPATIDFAPASTGRLYTLQTVADLSGGTWSNVPSMGPRLGSGGDDSMSDAGGAPSAFHRIHVAVP